MVLPFAFRHNHYRFTSTLTAILHSEWCQSLKSLKQRKYLRSFSRWRRKNRCVLRFIIDSRGNKFQAWSKTERRLKMIFLTSFYAIIYGNTIERVGGSTFEITLWNDLSRSQCVYKSCFFLYTNNHKRINRGVPEGIILSRIDQSVCWAYTHADPHLDTLMTKRFTSGGDCQHEMYRRKWRCNVDTLKGPLDHQGRHFIKGSSRRWSTRDETS